MSQNIYTYDSVNDQLVPISGGGGGGGGHVIKNESGTSMTQRSALQFDGLDVTDDSTNLATKVTARETNFVGTTAEWNALSTAEKAKYKTVDLTDDFNGDPVDPTPTAGSTNPVQSGGVYTSLQNKADNTSLQNKADKVANATNGNFAGLDAYGNLIDSGFKASDFLSSGYLETSVKTTADGKDTFTFSDPAITSTACFDPCSDVFGAPVVDMALSGTQLTVSYNSSDNVGTCRLYIK